MTADRSAMGEQGPQGSRGLDGARGADAVQVDLPPELQEAFAAAEAAADRQAAQVVLEDEAERAQAAMAEASGDSIVVADDVPEQKL